MKLIDLSPIWIIKDEKKQGILFLCPHCVGQTPRTWLSCFQVPQNSIAGPDGEYELFSHLIPEEDLHHAVPCKRNYAWNFTGDSFDNLTITPSIDASAAGHWHGFITNGEIR